MDVGFYILVPSIPSFEGFDYTVDRFVWDGVEYPQEPGQYVWGEHVQFLEADVTEPYMRMLPTGFITHDWRALCLRVRALSMLKEEVNGLEVDWAERSLEDVIRQILQRSVKWAVVFALHSDQIDSIYRLSVDMCIERLKQNLRWDVSPEGFVIISNDAHQQSKSGPSVTISVGR